MIKHPPMVFLDVETLGLGAAPIWEISGFRVVDGKVENAGFLELFVDHDPALMDPTLPQAFRDDYQKRFTDAKPLTVSPAKAVQAISYLARGRALVCGSNPGFDMQRIEAMARDNGLEPPPWHYHPEDVPTLARGWLHGKGIYPAPPWKSDLIAQMCGVDPRDYARHTAMGDCQFMWDLWKVVTTT